MKHITRLLILLGSVALFTSSCAAPVMPPAPTASQPPKPTMTETQLINDLIGEWSLEINGDWKTEYSILVHGCVPVIIEDRSSFPTINSEGPIDIHMQNVLPSILHEGCHYDMSVNGAVVVIGFAMTAVRSFNLVNIRLSRDPLTFNETLREICAGTPGPESEWPPRSMTDGGFLGHLWAAIIKTSFDAMQEPLVTRNKEKCILKAVDGAEVDCLALNFRLHRGAVCEPIPTAVPTFDKTMAADRRDTPSPGDQSSQAKTIIYIVAEGDTLDTIAERYSVTAEAIIIYNGLASKDDIFPGMSLSIPIQ